MNMMYNLFPRSFTDAFHAFILASGVFIAIFNVLQTYQNYSNLSGFALFLVRRGFYIASLFFFLVLIAVVYFNNKMENGSNRIKNIIDGLQTSVVFLITIYILSHLSLEDLAPPIQNFETPIADVTPVPTITNTPSATPPPTYTPDMTVIYATRQAELETQIAPMGLSPAQRQEVIEIIEQYSFDNNIDLTQTVEEVIRYIEDKYGVNILETLYCTISAIQNDVSIRREPYVDSTNSASNVIGYLYKDHSVQATAYQGTNMNSDLWWFVSFERDGKRIMGWIWSGVVIEETLGCSRLARGENLR